MVELLGGQETIPQDVGHPQALTVEQVNVMTQEGFGPSPAESQIAYDLAQKNRAIEAERERLAEMERAAAAAHETYYAEGGAGYGTVPGGPDYYYFPDTGIGYVAEGVYNVLDPYYGEGGALAPVTDWVTGKGDKDNLLLYAALGIGALALLKR